MAMETGSGAARFQTTPVKSVSTARASTDVYSIEVAENHTFVTTGGVLVHNCFPKDTAALMSAARHKGYEPDLLGEVVAVNEKQPRRMVELLERHIQLGEARVAVLGAAFKPGTDDTRGTRARPLIESLARRGATPVVYDPTEAAEVLVHEHEAAILADSAGSALDGADGAAVITDWDEFATLDSEFDLMAQPVVIDGRRIISRREGLTYEGLTW
jgi:UDPglucose 6-dehydrogenase